jgi:4-hydroxybenzoate polyprenyltransferase
VSLLAALKIIADVVVYRLRRLEMANLAAATSIAFSLRLPLIEVAGRTLFAFGLNVLVYLNNDYVDVHIDLQSSDKDRKKTRYLHDHMRAAYWAQWGLAGALAAVAIAWDPGLLVALVAGGGICIWYSIHLKRVPFLDVLAMMIWGLGMPACGVPLHSALGWCMAVQLALFSGVFESIQVMRDAEEDAVEGLRTTGVVLGKRKTLALARVIMVLVTSYAALLIHPLAALLTVGALVVPFDPMQMTRYWTRVKMVYGIAWLVICGYVFFMQTSAGLVWSVPASARFP